MNREQMQARLNKTQQDRQSLAVSIDQAVVRLHQMDGQIQFMSELLAEPEEQKEPEKPEEPKNG